MESLDRLFGSVIIILLIVTVFIICVGCAATM